MRIVLAFVGKELVRYPLLDIVSLARKDEQRLVLRLPAKAGYGTVVAAAIEFAGDA